MKKISLIGGTGLVGGELLKMLALHSEVESVTAVTRSPLNITSPRIKNVVVDFEKLSDCLEQVQSDVFICCLGTTIKKAGSQAAFQRVDYDYVIEWARLAEMVKANKFMVVSAMGADANSKIFYNRVKGQMEDELKRRSIPQIEIFQPSLILGERNEKRIGEGIGQVLAPVMNMVMQGPLKKYRPIKACDIAQAIAIKAFQFQEGRFTYPSEVIQKISEN